MRGGFPDSFIAASDADSLDWREAFIRTYLERDVPQFGPRIPSVALSRLYVPDSGLVHALLRLETLNDIAGHPVLGASWEGL